MKAEQFKQLFRNKEYDPLLLDIYADKKRIVQQRQRYIHALESYISNYGNDLIEIYSAPGRSEIGGNHTDHQNGCVLAAAINLDAIAIVSRQDKKINIISDQLRLQEIDVDDLEMREDEKGTSQALVRGILFKLKKEGYLIGGFKAYITSDVFIGSGLSSSACFEVLIATLLSGLYNLNKIDSVEIAKIAQYAENVYFGKPCGLMDQCACAVGSLVSIDFKDPKNPIVNALQVDFSSFKHSLCIVDTKGSHSNLIDEYASIPLEMKKVAKVFGEETLREVKEENFMMQLQIVREKCGDRALLRAFHFFNENRRVDDLIKNLIEGHFDVFKETIALSGNSSFKYLQNIYTTKDVICQNLSLALALSEYVLKDHGVCRVHGGGFAGTIQAFVENDYVETYKQEIEKNFGEGSCHILKIRKYGSLKIL